MTILKIAGAVAAVLLLVAGCGVLVAINSLRDPPYDPPEVEPLGRDATFQAERVVETDDGYLLAGVVGTSDPLRGRPCSGRFALVFLDGRGVATRSVVLSGLERDRFCAQRVSAVVPNSDGGWFIAGTGVRDGGPSALFPSKPSTDSVWVTFRVDPSGALVEAFDEDGAVRGHEVSGRVEGAVFTRRLERVSEDGSVHDDLVASDAQGEFWSSVEVEDELLVAVDSGLDLIFQAYERDAPAVAVYRPLHSLPAYQTEPTVDLGSEVSVGDSLLLGGILYVAVRDAAGTRINAVDPRRLAVVFEFNGTGAVRLPGLVTSAKLLAADADITAVTTTIDRGHQGDRLHVLRFAADGAQDASFGGRVKRNGRDVNLDPGLDDAMSDSAGRTLALGGGSTSIVRRESLLVRLDDSGKLDPSFGEDGIVRLGGVRVCALTAAAGTAACRSS
jgi:hypothetical protein